MDYVRHPARASRPTTVCVVGAGYVGLTAAACLSELGHRVHCLEADPAKLNLLQSGGIPIVEPRLAPMVAANLEAGRLEFTDDVDAAVADAQVVLLCVGTPPQPGGNPDLRQLAAAARQVAAAARSDLVVAVKSTVPPGTCEVIELLCADEAPEAVTVRVASNPEFLRESHAVDDFLFPDRVVIGADDPGTAGRLAGLYPEGDPMVICDRRSAELIKYAANTFLAVKISFANEIAGLCEHLGADPDAVLDGVGADARIGRAFLGAGPGFGGACLPKDVAGLIATAGAVGYQTRIADAALAVNAAVRDRVLATVACAVGSVADTPISVFGLAFKPDTDDVRDSPAVGVASALAAAGARLTVCDPLAAPVSVDAERVADPYRAAAGAAAVVIMTAWSQYSHLDPYRLAHVMAGSVVIDTVGVLDAEAYRRAGLEVLRIGQGVPGTYRPVVLGPMTWVLDPDPA